MIKVTLGSFDEEWGTIVADGDKVSYKPTIPAFKEILMSVWEDAGETTGLSGEALAKAMPDFMSGFGTWASVE